MGWLSSFLRGYERVRHAAAHTTQVTQISSGTGGHLSLGRRNLLENLNEELGVWMEIFCLFGCKEAEHRGLHLRYRSEILATYLPLSGR